MWSFGTRSGDFRGKWAGGRLGVLAGRDFRRFYVGYSASLLGTAMSSVAIAFAVLGNGGTPTALGLVLAANIVPMVALMIALALHLPVVAVAAGAGLGSAIGGAIIATVTQQRVPAAALSRVGAFTMVGAFAFGPAGPCPGPGNGNCIRRPGIGSSEGVITPAFEEWGNNAQH
jgi:hypothetical protein